MKNKKLFAVITLICFALTMMPVAAFAAGSTITGALGDEDVLPLTTDDTLKVTTSTATFFAWAEDKDGKVVAVENGNHEMKIGDAGSYTVFAVKDAGAQAALEAETATKAALVAMIYDRYAVDILDDTLSIKVKAPEYTYFLSALEQKGVTKEPGENNEYNLAIIADNGWEYTGEVTVVLQKGADKTNVKNAAIEYTTNSKFIDVELDTETTKNGKQKIFITATKSGEFKVYANYGDAEELVINVTVAPNGTSTITTVAEPARGTALDTKFVSQPSRTTEGEYDNGFTGVAFEITSADGSIREVIGAKGEDYKIAIVEKPSDSNLDADDLVLAYDKTVNNAFVLKAAKEDGAYTTPSFDAEGKYVIKVSLKNGAAATATVNVVKFIKPVKMNLMYMSNTVPFGQSVRVKSVSFIDKNGTVVSSAHDLYTKYAADLKYAANGKALSSCDAETGLIWAKGVNFKDEAKIVGETITAMVISEKLDLSATTVLTVVDQPMGLKFAKTTADVGVTNKLKVNTVDENGNIVAAGLTAAACKVQVYVVAPNNAVNYADASVTGTNGNEITVNFTAAETGAYEVTVVAEQGGKYYSTTETITVGNDSNNFKDIVVMSIGAAKLVKNGSVVAIPVAPVVKDGRTMVPLRAVIEAFGASCDYDAATQTITSSLNGTTVVMTVGSVDYTVNGVAMKADVAPYVVGEGYTMVPVRFVSQAFGITPTPIYGENGATSDVLFAK